MPTWEQKYVQPNTYTPSRRDIVMLEVSIASATVIVAWTSLMGWWGAAFIMLIWALMANLVIENKTRREQASGRR
jgi:hypothetical protein